MSYRRKKTQEESFCDRDADAYTYDDIFCGSNYLEAVEKGDISDHDTVVMFSIDGAQLNCNKKSDCWIYLVPDTQNIWIRSFSQASRTSLPFKEKGFVSMTPTVVWSLPLCSLSSLPSQTLLRWPRSAVLSATMAGGAADFFASSMDEISRV
jgi:hypothetical protein